MWLAGHIAGMLAITRAHKILPGNPERNEWRYLSLDWRMLLKLIIEMNMPIV